MPSPFSRFHFPSRLRRQGGKEPFNSQAAGQSSEQASSGAVQDPPPPYTAENHEVDHDEKESLCDPTSIRTTPAENPSQPDLRPPFCDFIRVCPHATSPFERIQRIVGLPNFKESYQGLDALTPGPNHRVISDFRYCRPESGSKLSIEGWGKYLYDPYGTACPRKDEGQPKTGEGLVLKFYWMIGFARVPPKQRQSREDIQRILSLAKIDFCVHSTLSDPRIVAAIYGILHPEDNDPIDTWIAGCKNGPTIVACEECATVAAISGVGTFVEIDTKRYLGKGEDCTDPSWLSQCGLREGATAETEKLN